MGILLFSDPVLSQKLEAIQKGVQYRLLRWDAEALLRAPDHDVVTTLLKEGTVHCPVLLRDRAWMLESTEVRLEETRSGKRVSRRVLALTLVVPYNGDKMVFLSRPSVRKPKLPKVEQLSSSELHIKIQRELTDAAHADRLFKQELEVISVYLTWAHADIERHNAMLEKNVPQMVAERRAELLAMRDLQAGIGYPIRRRPDAAVYAVPLKRRTIQPVPAPRETDRPFEPEPILEERDYEAALQVLIHQRNALERSPAVAAGMDEEMIRDLLLVGLNAQFEGAAAGEVFNGEGKTDILIRERDRNVFIGECKIWDGPKTVEVALGQLFRYLVWRDTKAALLLFIRRKNVTAAVKAAIKKIEAHPNFKRRGAHSSEDRIDFVMHADGDPKREIRLALLPFALPGGATSRFNRS